MFKKIVLMAGFAAMVMINVTGLVSAQETQVVLPETMSKRIYIGSPAQRQPLKVDFMPSKPSFAVDEAITFTIKGNKKFFLFLFNIDNTNNDAYLILPNEIQTTDRNMYQADQKLRVPNINAEFYSDRPGYERIIMIATTQYPRDIALDKYRRVGNFHMTNAKTVQNYLKRIQIRSPKIRSNTAEEFYIKEFDLPIHAAVKL